MILSIISIIFSLLALWLGLSALIEGRKASREFDGIIADIKIGMKQSRPAEGDTSFKDADVFFDKKSETLIVNGNIKADGYISAGNSKQD